MGKQTKRASPWPRTLHRPFIVHRPTSRLCGALGRAATTHRPRRFLPDWYLGVKQGQARRTSTSDAHVHRSRDAGSTCAITDRCSGSRIPGSIASITESALAFVPPAFISPRTAPNQLCRPGRGSCVVDARTNPAHVTHAECKWCPRGTSITSHTNAPTPITYAPSRSTCPSSSSWSSWSSMDEPPSKLPASLSRSTTAGCTTVATTTSIRAALSAHRWTSIRAV